MVSRSLKRSWGREVTIFHAVLLDMGMVFFFFFFFGIGFYCHQLELLDMYTTGPYGSPISDSGTTGRGHAYPVAPFVFHSYVRRWSPGLADYRVQWGAPKARSLQRLITFHGRTPAHGEGGECMGNGGREGVKCRGY